MDRKEIICDYSKSDFMEFVEHDHEGKILELLNDEGIDILDKYRFKIERLEYIMCYSAYRNDIFKNDRIDDMVIDHVNRFYANIGKLDYDTSIYLFNRCIKRDKNAGVIFLYFNNEYKDKILDNWSYSKELLYSILMNEGTIYKQKIIDNFDIDLSKINLDVFFKDCCEGTLSSKSNSYNIEMHIPIELLTNEVKEKIWNYTNIFQIRTIINNASYVTDASYINTYIKKKEIECIKSYINDNIVEPLNTIYRYIYRNYELSNNRTIEEIEYDEKEIEKFVSDKNIRDLFHKSLYEYSNNGIDGLYNHLKVLSNRHVSNCIIDYYFEDIYHNVILNINELLRYYYDGNIDIPSDRISIYERVSKIDSLNIYDKLELCNELDNINIMELFYDDMLKARTGVATSLKENAINIDTLPKYKDNELSNKYGVDIYTNDNIPFYGIIKSVTSKVGYDINPTGHSFSYVGDKNTNSYGKNTYLYDSKDFNPEQLIHVYPTDSFTLYRPFDYSVEATTRVNNLLNAEELINTSRGFNEILILEEGHKPSPIDSRIPKLKPLTLYCRDEITDEDIDKAKKEGLGIFLAKTKSKDNIKPLNDYRGDIDYWNYDYYDKNNYEEFENKRIK